MAPNVQQIQQGKATSKERNIRSRSLLYAQKENCRAWNRVTDTKVQNVKYHYKSDTHLAYCNENMSIPPFPLDISDSAHLMKENTTLDLHFLDLVGLDHVSKQAYGVGSSGASRRWNRGSSTS